MSRTLDKMVDAFHSELEKIAAVEQAKKFFKGKLGKHLPVAAAGIVTYEGLRRANNDRKLGKQLRQQQGGGYQ